MPTCRGCGGPLGRTNKSGYCKQTAECRKQGKRVTAHASYVRNADARREQARQWNASSREESPLLYKARHLLVSARGRAKRDGLPCDLTLEWAGRELASAIANGCPLLGIEVRLDAGRVSPGSPTIDKFNPDRGYTQKNCWVISHRANTMKQNATPDFMRRILEAADTRFAVDVAVQ